MRTIFGMGIAGILTFALGCGASSTGPGTASGIVSGTTTFDVTTVDADSAYTINGLDNPTLVVQRGLTYTINVSASGHPFYIMSVQGTNTSNAYSSGVTNNGAQTGVITFVVPNNAPNTLFYDCSVHSSMTGTITVTN